jgi:GNAT superfamily N-acetyltransferase
MSMPPTVTATVSSAIQVLPLREAYRLEMNCQIVHDSIHRRAGWTTTYLLSVDGEAAGFGSMAIGGPWTGKPTIFEMYLAPAYRSRAFDAFDTLLTASQARFLEIQSSDALLSVMLHTYAGEIRSEAIVFHDRLRTELPSMGAVMHGSMADSQIRQCIEARQGGPEFRLEWNGETVATGGILFHYNRPYGDIYMDVTEGHRRRGFGSYLVQELKRVAYTLECIPAARCSPENIPSRKTLQKAGFVPFATIVAATIRGV